MQAQYMQQSYYPYAAAYTNAAGAQQAAGKFYY